jgi:Domain of unknown function (DUF3883)
MRRAETYYGQRGWRCDNVSMTSPYDLHLTRTETGEELRVEVKGTASDGTTVLLTHGEVRHAREHRIIALFVVAGIRVPRLANGAPAAEGGHELVFDPWELDDARLDPLGYEYALPESPEKGQS